MRRFYLLLTVLLVIGNVSCSVFPNSSESNPLLEMPAPTPEFIIRLEPFPGQKGSFKNVIYVEINQEPLCEIGDRADDQGRHIFSSAKFTVDGKNISIDKYGSLIIDTLNAKYDENNELVCTYGGPILLSFEANLLAGVHIATFEITTLSGKNHVYSWAFEIR